MNILPLTIEGMVAVLLLLTILYCVRLSSQLKRFKADEKALRTTIAELVTATETAERCITGLKATVREADQTLGTRLQTAGRYCADIAQHTEAGTELLGRLVQIAGARGVAVPAAAPLPDAKTILAAASAFADRARARLKGVAA